MTLPFRESANKKILSIIDNPHRVYLLYGEAEIGKYLVSRYIAAQLLEDSKVEKSNYTHPNMFVISANIQNKPITISQIRELTERIWNTPSSKILQKIVIIQGIDNITISAANALLKILEDTPKDTTFILSAASLENVIPTIRSRSQLIFCSADKHLVAEYLQQQYNIDDQESSQLVEISNNKLTRAISNLDVNELEKTKYIKKSANHFLENNITNRFIIAKQISEKKLTDLFIEELIYATRQQSTILYDSLDSIETMVRGLDQIRNNVNARIVLENIALR